jgi:hypothetical protein
MNFSRSFLKKTQNRGQAMRTDEVCVKNEELAVSALALPMLEWAFISGEFTLSLEAFHP